MQDAFRVVEQIIPLSEHIEYADLSQELNKLYVRCGALQNANEAQQRQSYNAQRSLLLGLLEVADALERMLQFSGPIDQDETKKILERQRKNLEATLRLLLQKLANAGVTKIEVLGKILDPATTDADADQEDNMVADETVLREIISGYWWDDTVLRRARVLVSHRG